MGILIIRPTIRNGTGCCVRYAKATIGMRYKGGIRASNVVAIRRVFTDPSEGQCAMMPKEKAYKKWIQQQPSCVSGQFSEYFNGEGFCIAAHVRRVKHGAGTGIKPAMRYVPLTHDEHLLQHQHGESYFHPANWWDEKVSYYQKLYQRRRA